MTKKAVQAVEKSNVLAYSKMFDFLNVPLSGGIESIKKQLSKFDTNKTFYVLMFVGSIAFIANGIYALITMALAVLVAAWSLKNLMGT